MSIKIISRHDEFFRHAMSNKEVAKDFFEQHLPKHISQHIDLTTLQLQPESYFDEELKERITDVLYQVHNSNHEAYIYVLVEHLSHSDSLMPLRIIEYTLRIMRRHRQQYSGKTKLPLVFPLVFYNGEKPYSYSCDIFDLVDDPLNLGREILFKPFHLIDLSQFEDDAIRSRYWCGVMQFLMKHIHAPDMIPYLRQITHQLNLILETPFGKTYIEAALTYIITSGEINENEFSKWLKDEAVTIKEEKIMTLAQQWAQEGFEKGIAQGMQQGMQMGEHLLLLKLLRRKFVVIPQTYEQRIKAAEEDTLIEWAERVSAAKTLQDVFGD